MQKTPVPYFGDKAVLYSDCSIRQAMPLIKGSKLNPISPAVVMDTRNKSPFADNELWSSCWDTGFGLAADQKNVYFFPDSEKLRKLTPQTKLTNHGILETARTIEDAKCIARSDMILNRDLTENEARSHAGWLQLANGNQNLLDTYVQNTFKLGMNRFKYTTMMGLYVHNDEKPILRAVILGSLLSRSFAVGDRILGDDGVARLVGGKWRVCEADEKNSKENLDSLVLKEMKSGKQAVQVGNNIYILAPKEVSLKR